MLIYSLCGAKIIKSVILFVSLQQNYHYFQKENMRTKRTITLFVLLILTIAASADTAEILRTETTKQTYACAFGIYGLAEHFRATGDRRSLAPSL